MGLVRGKTNRPSGPCDAPVGGGRETFRVGRKWAVKCYDFACRGHHYDGSRSRFGVKQLPPAYSSQPLSNRACLVDHCPVGVNQQLGGHPRSFESAWERHAATSDARHLPMAQCVMRILILLLGFLAIVTQGRGEPAIVESFDGPELRWQLAEGATPAQLVQHEIARDGARSQSGAERMVVAGSAGHSATLVYPIAPMPVLDEFSARIWIRASRPGIQLAARVVMPRTIDPRTGRPATTIVRSASPPYDRPGHWRQLALHELPKQLAAEVRIMRTLPGANVDPREAFVDAIALNVPCQPLGDEILADELEVEGIIKPASAVVARSPLSPGTTANRQAERPADDRGGAADIAAHQETSAPRIRLVGSTLQVDGRMFLPRIVNWNGEPLQYLAERGFNVVRMDGVPTDEQSAKAERHKLWFLCRPPGPESLRDEGFGGATERVLAWYLDDEVARRDAAYLSRWAEVVRTQDRASSRPIVVAPLAQWEAMSKAADVLVVERPPAYRSTSREFQQWFEERRGLARPGTPLWVGIPTQYGTAVTRQLRALGDETESSPSLDDSLVESLVHVAAASGARGFVFQSYTSLSTEGPEAKHRSALLEQLNIELQLLEPWLSGGKVLGRLVASSSRSSHESSTAVLMQVDHARLLIPDEFDRFMGESQGYTVPGIPNSNRILCFSPAGLQPLDGQRVAGGTNIVLPSGWDGWVLMTEDPQVIQALRRQIAAIAPRSAKVRVELATARLADCQAGARRLAARGDTAQSTARIEAAKRSTGRGGQQLANGQIEEAYLAAGEALRIIDAIIEGQRNELIQSIGVSSSALDVSHASIVKYDQRLASLAKLHGRENKLLGGDFEDLGQLMNVGWQHVKHPLPHVDARAELSAQSPHQGSYCLQLVADSTISPAIGKHARGGPTLADAPKNPRPVFPAIQAEFDDPFQRAPGFATEPNDRSGAQSDRPTVELSASTVPAAPLWITSPAIPVEVGQVLEITGWVRIETPIRGSVNGLQIVDTLGGEELAISIHQTSGWQPFRMLRAVPESTELEISFILTGIGAAQIDAVMVRPLGQPVVRRLPPTSTVSLPIDRQSALSEPGKPVRLPAPTLAR